MTVRHLVSAITIAAGLAAVPAYAAEEAEKGPVRLDYSVYFGGFNVVAMSADVDMEKRGYEVTTHIKTVGMASWISSWRSVGFTEGAILGSTLSPRRYRIDAENRGKNRIISMEFGAGGDVTTLFLVPTPTDDNGRDAVPPEKMKGSSDPMTALLSVSHKVSAEKSCAGRVPVFDGRRRYDVVVEDRGTENLAPNDHNSFSGDAVRCDFHVERIAGYDQRVTDEDAKKQRFRTGRAWFAEILPGRAAIPVRIEIDGDFVPTLVHLRDVQQPVIAQKPAP